ncbi:hypothetical protein ACU635_37550 [[Actinomadura] parvosata]|uniref:hypothetical protein n=1 Tax=[Actinomadura] parvosata TaxID=1955412 RepID=UPI00406C7B4C
MRTIRAAALLTLAALPMGGAVTALNLAVTAHAEQVIRASLAARPGLVQAALHRLNAVALTRTVEIGALFVVYALLMGAVIGVARRGSARWSFLVPSSATALSLSYVYWLYQAHAGNPVADDFWYLLWDFWYESGPARSGTEPFTGYATTPAWYSGTLTATLVAAAVLALPVPFLLRRARPAAGLPHGRHAVFLALVGPVAAVSYAAVNLLGIARAGDLVTETSGAATEVAADSWATTWRLALMLFVLSAILTALCLVLLRSGGSALPYAALTVIYGLALLFTLFADISEMSNETSGFTDFRPWWRTPGLVNLLVLAGLAQVMSVAHAMRGRRGTCAGSANLAPH